MKEKPKDPKLVNPDLPDWVCRVILRCLEKDQESRYQTAGEILADLDAHRSSSSHSQSVVLEITPRAAKWTGTLIRLFLLLVVIVFALLYNRHWAFRSGRSTVGGVQRNGLPPLSKGKYVAILPFRALGGEESLGYVADGLGEALTAKLFQLSDVRIASTNAAQKTNDQKTPLPQIAKELRQNESQRWRATATKIYKF